MVHSTLVRLKFELAASDGSFFFFALAALGAAPGEPFGFGSVARAPEELSRSKNAADIVASDTVSAPQLHYQPSLLPN